MKIQDYFGRQSNPYSHENAKNLTVLIRTWLQDIHSDLTQESIVVDAGCCQMQISANPTVAVFDINYNGF